ncbi:MAG: hypothetical protein J5I81_00355 [Nitrococcus mobilis]|nr:hypothetical protein [Nitrococcus mobilis]
MSDNSQSILSARRLEIDTLDEPVVYMRWDCHVCRAEGFRARSRIALHHGERSAIATINVVHGERLRAGEIGLSVEAARQLAAGNGDPIRISHAPTLASFSHVRAKIYGETLEEEQLTAVISDIAARRYSDVQLTAFVTTCAQRLSQREITALTRALWLPASD